MEQQTFYAVLDGHDEIIAGPYENANKADAVAKDEAKRWGESYRVAEFTVIATFGGTDE